MVKKEHAPLQIRLTEPVIFLRGPSTGTDFRGRPQITARDGQPAMVRGLLTLRLHKPTRIRSITVSLEGKSRTEWPEGIGPRRTDTFEETPIMSETTTFFSAAEGIASKATRRSHSLGPGAMAQYDLDYDELEGDDFGLPDSYLAPPDRGRPPRSASVLPSNPDDWMTWHRDGYSRPASPEPQAPATPSRDASALSLSNMRLLDQPRGPSPAYSSAYTPPHSAATNIGSGIPRPSSLREVTSLVPQRDPLSPIASANVSANVSSRGTSERDPSTETDSRLRHGTDLEDVVEGARTPAGEDASSFPPVSDPGPPTATAIRFQSPLQPQTELPNDDDDDAEEHAGDEQDISENPHQSSSPDLLATPTGHVDPRRAPSLRTIDSTTSSHSSRSALGLSEYHPVSSAHQPVATAVSSPVNGTPPGGSSHQSPSGSRPPSVHEGSELPQRRWSSGLRPGSTPSLGPSPNTSGETPDVRQGQQNSTRGPASVIVNHHAHSPSPGPSDLTSTSSSSHVDDRGRKGVVHHPNHHHHHKFSIAAALRGLSQDVKDRVRSHSRPTSRPSSRASSRTRAETPGGGSRRAETPSAPLHNDSSSVSVPMSHQSSLSSATAHRAAAEEFVHPHGRGGAGAGRRSRSVDTHAHGGKSSGAHSPALVPDDRGRSRHRLNLLADVLGKGEDEEEVHMHNWKEFRKGVYNYPISFPIPAEAPPSITCEFGSVVYKLKATVVRAGALTSNLTEEMEVAMIAGPQEDDMEETDNVIVERQWEDQMRYQIALSGKAFPIGGTIPISIRLMPLTKCKIYRITVALEEKSDYYAVGRKVARHENPRRFIMFAAKNSDPNNKKERAAPLLPILSENVSIKDSPLAELARNAVLNNPREFADYFNPEDDVYASLLDPMGPWHLEKDLRVPDCACRIKFTTKHEHTNISVAHWLKVTIRVERGDDVAVDSKGRRKQFDIIIETPIKILDCRVNPQYNSLPSYERVGHDQAALGVGCSMHAKQSAASMHAKSAAGTPGVSHSSHLNLTGFIDSALHIGGDHGLHIVSSPLQHTDTLSSTSAHRVDAPEHEDTLLERNIVYDRLMSGQETETGEEPPSYGEAVASAIRSARSASRMGAPAGSGSSTPTGTSRSRSRAAGNESPSSRASSRTRSRARMYIEA